MQETITKQIWKIKLEEILQNANINTNIEDRNNSIKIDQSTLNKIRGILEKESKQYEVRMPNVEIGAICSGLFLCNRGYQLLANQYCIKPENCKTYIFEAVNILKESAASSVIIHPFYELIHIIKENNPIKKQSNLDQL
jgi:hypothetical protein